MEALYLLGAITVVISAPEFLIFRVWNYNGNYPIKGRLPRRIHYHREGARSIGFIGRVWGDRLCLSIGVRNPFHP